MIIFLLKLNENFTDSVTNIFFQCGIIEWFSEGFIKTSRLRFLPVPSRTFRDFIMIKVRRERERERGLRTIAVESSNAVNLEEKGYRGSPGELASKAGIIARNKIYRGVDHA